MDDVVLMTPASLLAHWQGHRDLTRRVIEAFEEKDFETYHARGMRPFRVLALELSHMVDYQLGWFRTGKPQTAEGGAPSQALPSRAQILQRWDEQTRELNEVVPMVSADMWLTPMETPFGHMSPFKSTEYLIDNEIHHRGQGYVYLRELGIKPPDFFDRSEIHQP